MKINNYIKEAEELYYEKKIRQLEYAKTIIFKSKNRTYTLEDSNNYNDLLSNAVTTVNGVNLGLTVTFQGITTDVSVVADSMGKTSNVAITNLHVNQAIKDAINNDAAQLYPL